MAWTILHWLIQIFIASGVSILAFIGLSFTRIGERFIANRFEHKLAAFRHDQNKEITQLKSQLSHLEDRGKRSNEQEFRALSEIWDKFIDAFLATQQCVINYLQYPDFSRLSEAEIDSFLASTELSEQQRAAVRRANDKNKAFSDTITLRQINTAANEIYDLRLLLRKKRIFVPAEIVSKFEAHVELLSKAQIERRMSFSHSSGVGYDESMKLINSADKMQDELGSAVRARLLKE